MTLLITITGSKISLLLPLSMAEVWANSSTQTNLEPGVCKAVGMSHPYLRHRFPSEIISYCVLLYYSFPLSYRDIEKIMFYQGIKITYESIRCWCQKFAQQYANQIRLRCPKLTDKWPLDRMAVKIKEQQYYLWRAVDK
jgi:transposase-like protein